MIRLDSGLVQVLASRGIRERLREGKRITIKCPKCGTLRQCSCIGIQKDEQGNPSFEVYSCETCEDTILVPYYLNN
jgi:DNA-directed RNA polymerase subunit M/transcription elongation factor TFIIS